MTVYAAAPRTLDGAALELYRRQGYLAFEGLLTEAEVEEAREALSLIVRRIHAAAKSGSPDIRVHPSNPRQPENHQGVEIEEKGRFRVDFQAGVDPMVLSSEEAELKARKLANFSDQHPALRRLANHPRMLAIVESILGPDALPFMEMGLVKPPFIGSEKPWHQDDAYFSYAPLDQVLGVWIALDPAGRENGCMHVLSGMHRQGGFRHQQGRLDCEIAPGRIRAEEAKPIELAPGGALFFSGMLPHQTPPNRSPHRRRALQFHFRGVGTRKVEREEYDRLFVEPDGSPASCRAAGA